MTCIYLSCNLSARAVRTRTVHSLRLAARVRGWHSDGVRGFGTSDYECVSGGIPFSVWVGYLRDSEERGAPRSGVGFPRRKPSVIWLVNDPPRPARTAHCAAWVKSDKGRTGALVQVGDCDINIASMKPSTCISSLGNGFELRK